ncbi:putative ferric reductase transmembrane component [Aspergillus ellipticus CBS 707.79]|uniref:ferric-chelate reductase (NADPH) n=1 Tax=Aspergillus ellipticus CBS 707.79 TaxID=1448320 RepID=A0A319DMB5_9EURO|nr:putative ferric reductase transmembrane component [Aspergillus ellipticus CBS 707.79]
MGMLPWLDSPVMLHSDRDPGECTMTPEQCAYKSGYWVNWYQDDHRYALPTVAFFLVAIVLFIFGHWASIFVPARLQRTACWSRLVAFLRFLSYKNWRMMDWSTPCLGAFLLGGAGAVYLLAMTLGPHPYYWPNTKEISFGNSPPIATRAGFMALACMPFLYVLGAKANPVSALTGISHERLNLWHNWVAWAMYVLALVHTFPFIVFHIWKGDIVTQWNDGGIWVTGVVAILAQTWLTFLSIPWIRNRYYEVFKSTHYIAALVFIIFFFFHCDFRLSSWDYFIATAVLYTTCWFYSQLKTWCEHGVRHKALLHRETDDTLKITIPTTTVRWKLGQHMFLRFVAGGAHMLTAHPFTICSVPQHDKASRLVFYVRPRGGITDRLMALATKQPGAAVPVLMEGPYGGVSSQHLASAGSKLVVGGGAGAGLALSFIESYVRDAEGQSSLKVIVATRDPGMRIWYTEALEEIAARHEKGESIPGLSIHLHETGPEVEQDTTKQIHTNDGLKEEGMQLAKEERNVKASGFNLTFSRGRPNLPLVVQEFVEGHESMGIIVCGPASMSHDMSEAAAAAQTKIMSGRGQARDVCFHQESFSY